MVENNVNSAIIIGGGLVGGLCATFLAKRGYQVTLYEYRPDIRKTKNAKGRSINLALSHRGRAALRFIGLESKILKKSIPMKGRFLHLDNRNKSVLYDPHTNQCIYSINRNFLNRLLLTEAESYPNVKIHFNHKLVSSNVEEESVEILDLLTNQSKTCTANLIIGADGAFSALRRTMQQTALFEYSQTYIKHGYLELTIPKNKGDSLVPNHLHIWPRGEFMMIALPNQDVSWTVTLFMPFDKFQALDSAEKIVEFFRSTFPDSVPLLGEKALVSTFEKTKPSPLVSIKCNPYHIGSKYMIMGDAAHAMVPFYGQGMNAGFEDCLILNEILDDKGDNVKMAIEEFSKKRCEDAYAICDLAMYNYVEMRDLVTRKSYHFRKTLDEWLFVLIGDKWLPLYNSISFSELPYRECVANRRWQNKILKRVLHGFFILLTVLSLWLTILRMR